MNRKKLILRILITIIVAGLIYYFFYPPINLTSLKFWLYVSIVILAYAFTAILNVNNIDVIIKNKKKLGFNDFVVIIPLGIWLLILLTNFIFSPVFMSGSYKNRIAIKEDGNFTEDIAEADFDALPILDKASSQKLGDRVMGQMPELVSQYYVSDLYTQINYQNKIIRVTPLEYNGIIKYFTNRKHGIMGYITVDSISGEADLVKLDKGMKYMPSALFSENLYRYVQHKYKTDILGKASFEIDNDGKPYWIIPTIKYVGIGIRKDITGVIIVDPITGKTQKYKIEDIPTWVDHVYSAALIIEQVNDWGQYKNGFLNSIFSQKNVVATTDGYNYTVMNDDVYLYTGITSVVADEANIGFILTNLRTKETNFYPVPGAEEYSAMASAEGQVQQMSYTSSFPLLINLNNKPTYFMSLKDNAGLVKMYAFVDVTDYQKVVVTDVTKGIKEAVSNYLNNIDNGLPTDLITKEITVKDIKEIIIDSNTYFYFKDNDNQKYRVSIKVNTNLLPFINSGDKIKIGYHLENDVIEIKEVS